MRKHTLLALTAMLVATSQFPLILSAQPSLYPLWSHNQPGWGHGDDVSCGVGTDSAGNVYTGGTTPSVRYDYNDFLVLKYSPSGALLCWTTFDNPDHGDDEARKCVADASGNVYITGRSDRRASSGDIVTVKYNTQGNREWASYFNGPFNGYDEGWGLARDAAGNVYVTGSVATGAGFEARDIVTIKYNALGQELWSALYNSPANRTDEGFYPALDRQGNVYVAGTALLNGYGCPQLVILKYNVVGIMQWAAIDTFPYGMEENPAGLELDSQDNVYVAGSFRENAGWNGPNNYFAVKHLSTGQRQWMATYDDPASGSDEVAYSMALDADGDLSITGWLRLYYPYRSLILTVKFASGGNVAWVRTYGDDAGGEGVAMDGAGNAYVTGWSGYDCTVIKYDAQGDTIWTASYSDSSSLLEGRFPCFDGHGNVIIGGAAMNIDGLDYNFLTLKYRQPSTYSAITSSASPNREVSVSCFPNPFNPTTAISYELRAASKVRLTVYDIAGRLVATLADGWQEAGIHEAVFDGSRLPSGIYFARVQAGEFTSVQKMMLLK